VKRGTHSPYGPVAFRDRSTGRVTLTRSTLVERTLDTEGRVEAFQRRYGGTR
jgi:large subunit ribosomal protein L31